MVSAETAIACSAITKVYRAGNTEVHALRGVDLDVRQSELLMLVGPSGCGKTTLISIIAGILDPSQGTCTVYCRNMADMSGAERTRYRGQTVGFVFQSFNLLPALTAAENAAIPLLVAGTPRREAVERATAVLEKVGIAEKARALPSQLSGGQQQRVAIARALVHQPRLIVCDEPTSALDGQTGNRVMELLRAVALGDGRSLIIVTHDARVFHFADRIAEMEDGRIQRVVSSVRELEEGTSEAAETARISQRHHLSELVEDRPETPAPHADPRSTP